MSSEAFDAVKKFRTNASLLVQYALPLCVWALLSCSAAEELHLPLPIAGASADHHAYQAMQVQRAQAIERENDRLKFFMMLAAKARE